jgi:phage gp16-like protein
MEAPPAGISPVLRASWKFAKSTAQRFNQELVKNRVDEFLKKLAKRFV